jgi:hypothetical protein
MTRTPPLLPSEALARVVRVSHIHGTMMLGLAGAFALLAAGAGETIGAAAGLLVAGAGAMERHGSMLLEAGERRGLRWTIVAELFAMFSILVYCQVRLITFDLPTLAHYLPDANKAQLAANGIGLDEVLRIYRLGLIAVAVGTVLYQSGMAFYYVRRRRAVETALGQEAEVP